jgi:hypothetical protein
MEDVAPSGSEGSLGTCVPREDKKKSVPRKDKKKSVPGKTKRKVEVLMKQPLPILLKSKIRFILIL